MDTGQQLPGDQVNEAEHIDRLRAFAHWFAMNGGHMTEECKDALTLLGEYDVLKARLAVTERALGFLQRYSPSLHQDLLNDAQNSIDAALAGGEKP